MAHAFCDNYSSKKTTIVHPTQNIFQILLIVQQFFAILNRTDFSWTQRKRITPMKTFVNLSGTKEENEIVSKFVNTLSENIHINCNMRTSKKRKKLI